MRVGATRSDLHISGSHFNWSLENGLELGPEGLKPLGRWRLLDHWASLSAINWERGGEQNIIPYSSRSQAVGSQTCKHMKMIRCDELRIKGE